MNTDELTGVRKRDALALAELIYDIYLEKKQSESSDD